MFNLFPRKKSVDEILEDAGLPTEDLYKSIKKEASDLASGFVTGVYEIIALKKELQYQLDINAELKEETEELKLMSKERDNKWRTFNNSLHAQIKGLKEENEKLKDGNSQWSKLYEDVCKDRKELEDILGSVAEDGTYEHNNAVKLREQLAEVKLVNENLSKAVDEHKAEKEKLELKLVAYQKMTEGASESINDLNKRVNNLNHLKEENVNLIDKVRQLEVANERWQSRFNTFENMEKQIINNDYALCARQRDEYKHQLNAANKEIEALKEYYNTLPKLPEEEEQYHPMYPIHWGGIDPDILKQAQEQNIEEVVDSLKGMKTQGFEDWDPRDFEQPLPKTFPNEFQEETTAENLEEKFNKGEDVTDYFKPYHCPCNMCKHAKDECQDKSWEEAASDLALRVIKLEKKIEGLTIGNIYGSNFKI